MTNIKYIVAFKGFGMHIIAKKLQIKNGVFKADQQEIS